jgi:integration host factor subunit alpha
MTKADIVDNIYNSLGLTKKDINMVVDTIFEAMKDNLIKKNSIKISGFGSFEVKKRGKRIGRNPKTGEEKIIEPRCVVVFKPSKVFKNEINGKKQ